MIKSKQIDEVNQMEWNYITSITKAQIENLIKQQVFQMELFESEPIEVKDGDVRYILRRNAQRADQIQANRTDKFTRIEDFISKQNQYLKDHPRAKVDIAINRVELKITKLKLNKMIQLTCKDRCIVMVKNDDAIEQAALLDG